MIAIPANTETLAKQLLDLLDEEIHLLGIRQSHLERLWSVILKREESALEKLLEEMEQAHHKQVATDVRLENLRKSFADLLGFDRDKLKLANLVEIVPGELGTAINQRRQQIVALAEKTRQQHLRTALLLHESSQINRALLSAIFPQSEPVLTYDQDGQSLWRADTGLIDSEI